MTPSVSSGNPNVASSAPTVVMVDEQNNRLMVNEWACADPDVLAWARRQPGNELVPRFGQVVKLGILALDAVGTRATLAEVEKSFEAMRSKLLADMNGLVGPDGRFTLELSQHYDSMENALNTYLGRDGELARQLAEAIGEDSEFEARLKGFLSPNGDLSIFMQTYLGDNGRLKAILDAYVGDKGKVAEQLDEVFGPRGEFRSELDRVFGENGGLVYRLLNPTDENAPLGKFRAVMLDTLDIRKPESPFGLIMRKLDGIETAVAGQKATKAEAQKGTDKGNKFQDRVYAALLPVALKYDDQLEHTANEQGLTGKKGDHLATVATGREPVRIVFEDKNGRVAFVGKDSIWREIEAAKENRQAAFAVCVIADANKPQEAPVLQFVAPNKTVIVYVDDEDPASPALDAAYALARLLALSEVTAAGTRKLTATEIQAYVERIGRSLQMVRAMKTSLTRSIENLEGVQETLVQMQTEIAAALEDLQRELDE